MYLMPGEAAEAIDRAWSAFLTDDGPQLWTLSGDISEVPRSLEEIARERRDTHYVAIARQGPGLTISAVSPERNGRLRVVQQLLPPLVDFASGIAKVGLVALREWLNVELAEDSDDYPGDLTLLFSVLRQISVERPVVLLLCALGEEQDYGKGIVEGALAMWRSLVRTELNFLLVIAEQAVQAELIPHSDLVLDIGVLRPEDVARSQQIYRADAQLLLDVTLTSTAAEIREFGNYLRRAGVLRPDGLGMFKFTSLTERQAIRTGFATYFLTWVPTESVRTLKFALCQGRFVSTAILASAAGLTQEEARSFLTGDGSEAWVYRPFAQAGGSDLDAVQVGTTDDVFYLSVSDAALRWLRLGADVIGSEEATRTLEVATPLLIEDPLTKQWLRDIAEVADDHHLAVTLRAPIGALILKARAQIVGCAEVGMALDSRFIGEFEDADVYVEAILDLLEDNRIRADATRTLEHVLHLMRRARLCTLPNKALVTSFAARSLYNHIPTEIQLQLSQAAVLLAKSDPALQDHHLVHYVMDLSLAGRVGDALDVGIPTALRLRRRALWSSDAQKSYCNCCAHIGEAYFRLGRLTAAKRAYTRALGKDSIRPQAEARLFVIAGLMGNKTDALSYWDSARDHAMLRSDFYVLHTLVEQRDTFERLDGDSYRLDPTDRANILHLCERASVTTGQVPRVATPPVPDGPYANRLREFLAAE